MSAIDVTQYTAHLHPGKFQGESPAAEYFYEQMMEGSGETIFAHVEQEGEECDAFCDSPCAEIFHVTSEEAEAFGLPRGHKYMLREDSQGFVYGSCHATIAEAEAKFRSWIGL